MYLVADKGRGLAPAQELDRSQLPSDPWHAFPFSCLSHHGTTCCDIAREWVIANDFAQLNGGDRFSGPRWMREKYQWGPSSWPLHWCDAVSRDVIDCGAHAALAHEAFIARGLTAFRAQFVQRYSPDATGQWRRTWSDEQASDQWITDGFIYHEGNALLVGDGEVKLWDGSAGWWLNPRQSGGYGSTAAVRIFSEADPDAVLRWGDHRIVPNTWHQIGAADTGSTHADTQTKAFCRK